MKKKMDKVDAFFICFSLFLSWIFVIFLTPNPVMMIIYLLIASFAVGRFIGNLYARLRFESELEILERQFILIESMLDDFQIFDARCAILQATIDELMLEYCPDKMTPEQLARLAEHQQSTKVNLH